MGSDREQELARTATAAASGATTDPPVSLGATLGRYRLERELGAGAMGIVHAAFDPDLERRIALKVLRAATAAAEARDRLLREARAMARLSHPNVVTVYEVGTAGGRDFVAMELIHGGSLAEWLRAERRRPAAILDAFLAAGRGLAAAHAAGIVHRDFKPHNVLRSRDGRIVVTDFGLAREAHDAPSAALDATLPAGAMSTTAGGSASGSSSSSLLAGLTVTGSLLGTPAYMASEQWSGGAVTPATDQFAYCVALWEAFAGARPYPGPTLDDLRAQVARGPAALDASRIPRRIRGILRRGLDPDPARRWPSMEALLARLVRVQRRPGIALAIAAGALAGIAALVFALRGSDAPIALCDPPARDVAAVWSPAIRAELRAATSDAHVAVLDTAYWGWRAARGAACGAPPQVRQAQLACLDGVLDRFDVLRQAFARKPGAAAEEIQAALVDPAICRKPPAGDVPRLGLKPTPAVIDAYALYARSQTEHKPGDAEILALAEPTADPCARAIAALAFDDASWDVARQRAVMSRAVSSVDQCGDDRLRADLLTRSAWDLRSQPISGDQADAALRQAEIAANRVMQPDLDAAVAALHRMQARRHGDWDERFRMVEREIAGYRARALPARQLKAVIARNGLRMQRLDPGDLDAILADVRRWRPIAVAQHWTELAWQLDRSAAFVQLQRGELARAHDELMRLWQTRPPSGDPPGRTIEGQVVDDRGRPAAGATVATALSLTADSIGIGLPISDDGFQTATTDAAGRFELHDVALGCPIAAQLGDRRSRPVASADHLRLVLEPTRSVSGKVDLGGVPHDRVGVFAYPLDTATLSITIAPVAADGSFSISGVTRGAVFLTVRIEGRELGERGDYLRLPASPGPVGDVALAIRPARRVFDIVVRSSVTAAISSAPAWVMPGHWEIKNIGDLLRSPAIAQGELHPQQVGDSVPPALAGKVRRDDLLQHVEHVPDGELTVCACNFPMDLDPTAEQRLMAHVTDLVVRCQYPGPGDQLVVLTVPPQQRFE
ncbi:MAG TPA: protein kinase [Kofleriaceae bacterium]|nr:protein kinase [Kofleriaceae bacterium]